MTKALRLVFSVAVLSGLAVSQIPAPGRCQMLYGRFLATGCSMPCCRTRMPMPKCPMLKASVSRDVIASTPSHRNIVPPLHAIGLAALPAFEPLHSWLLTYERMVSLFLCGPPRAARAPPSDAHLLDA